MIRKFFWVSVFVAMFALLIGTEGRVQAADEWFTLGERTIKAVDQGVDIESDGLAVNRRVKKIRLRVEQADVEIRIAHYPSYASKWNPIEHRLFCHITRSLKGVILKSYDIVKELIESTMTKTGLRVKANIIKKVYKTGKKYAVNYKKEMQIKFDEKLGKWNYRAIPIKA